MDHEYLQNMMGSPYVNEGGFSRLKAKGAQAMGALGAMAGHQIQSPQETQLRSLWEGFMSSLKKALQDWESQVSPMFDQQHPLDGKAEHIKHTLDTLARTVSSTLPRKIGTAHDDYSDPGVRTQRRDPDTYVKGSAYNRSTTSPPKTPTKLTELIDEGFWDAAKRDTGLNKSLGSNDPSTILDSYKNYVLSIFQNFMKDAVKVTKMTTQQIYAMLSKMQPLKSGWQAAGNMQKVVMQLNTLQKIGDIKGQGAPPVINPPAGGTPQPQKPNEPYKGPTPPVIEPPKEAPQPQQEPTKPQQPQAPSGGGIPGGGGGNVPPEWLPFVVLKAMKIIIDAVKSDKQHVGTFFTTKELPTDYGGDPLHGKVSSPQSSMTETVVGPKPKDSGDDDDLIEPEEKEVPNQFLYNFHSKHRKTPAAPFSIQVKPVSENPVIKELPGSPKVDVWWQNEGHKNRIIAVVNGVKIPIMQFFDNEVSSKAGATTPGDANFFTADKILQAANPNAESPIAKASEQIKGQIKQLEPELHRALMATTGRKPMEFVPKTKLFALAVDEEGNVTTKDGTFDKEAVKQQLDPAITKPKMVERWYATLDAAGYFDKFPDMKPSSGGGQATAPAAGTPKAFEDAVMALVKLGYKEPVAKKELAQAWTNLKATKDASKITADELVHAVVSGKKPPATPAPPAPSKPEEPSGTKVSEPASGPAPSKAPTAPVSGTASGPAPTTTPTAPVSDKGKEDAAKKSEQPPMQYSNVPGKDVPQQPQQPEAEPSKGNFGPVKIRRNKLEWEHPKTHEIHLVAADDIENFAKKQPKFAKALTANPDLYSKYKAMIEKQKQAQAQQPNPEGGEGEKPQVAERLDYINPFNRENLFL